MARPRSACSRAEKWWRRPWSWWPRPRRRASSTSWREQVESRKPAANTDPAGFERGRLALVCLIQIARADLAGAAKTIEAIEPLLGKLAPDVPLCARWPELLVAARATRAAPLRPQASRMLDVLLEQARKRDQKNDEFPAYSNTLRASALELRGRALLLASLDKDAAALPQATGADRAAPGWSRVTHSRAQTRGEGKPIALWSEHSGVFTHYPGHDLDMMYLSVPLRGDFQLDCEVSPRRERRSGSSTPARPSLPAATSRCWSGSGWAGRLSDEAVNPPLEKLGDWYPLRLVLTGGRLTTFVNGRKVSESSLPDESDPWLGFGLPRERDGLGPLDQDHRQPAHSREAQPFRHSGPGRLAGQRIRRGERRGSGMGPARRGDHGRIE